MSDNNDRETRMLNGCALIVAVVFICLALRTCGVW